MATKADVDKAYIRGYKGGYADGLLAARNAVSEDTPEYEALTKLIEADE